jgi:hypothetical protein
MTQLAIAILLEAYYQRRNAYLVSQGKAPYSRKLWLKKNPGAEAW